MRKLLDYAEVPFNRIGTETHTGANAISRVLHESWRVGRKNGLFLEALRGGLVNSKRLPAEEGSGR